MSPDCLADQTRLLARTAALNRRTKELAPGKRPFSRDEHDDLKAQLAAHKAHLAAFTARGSLRRFEKTQSEMADANHTLCAMGAGDRLEVTGAPTEHLHV